MTTQPQQMPSTDEMTYEEFKNKMESIAYLSSNDHHYQKMMNDLENIKYITYPDETEKRVDVKNALQTAHRNSRGDRGIVEADKLINDNEIVYNNNVSRRLFDGGYLSQEGVKNKKKYNKRKTNKKRKTSKKLN